MFFLWSEFKHIINKGRKWKWWQVPSFKPLTSDFPTHNFIWPLYKDIYQFAPYSITFQLTSYLYIVSDDNCANVVS